MKEQYEQMIKDLIDNIIFMLGLEDNKQYEMKANAEHWALAFDSIFRTGDTYMLMGDDEIYLHECPIELLMNVEKVLMADKELHPPNKYVEMWKELDVVDKKQRVIFLNVIKKNFLDSEMKELEARTESGGIYGLAQDNWVTSYDFCNRPIPDHELHIERVSTKLLALFADSSVRRLK